MTSVDLNYFYRMVQFEVGVRYTNEILRFTLPENVFVGCDFEGFGIWCRYASLLFSNITWNTDDVYVSVSKLLLRVCLYASRPALVLFRDHLYSKTMHLVHVVKSQLWFYPIAKRPLLIKDHFLFPAWPPSILP